MGRTAAAILFGIAVESLLVEIALFTARPTVAPNERADRTRAEAALISSESLTVC